MKLTKADREFLKRNFWENDEDIDQIERVTTHTRFRYNGKRIGIKKAIELLGREKFLSGMDRCAFHCTAVQYTDDREEVFFNSREFFKDIWEAP